MKKILATILILFGIMFTACSTTKSTANTSKQALSTETELIIGTFKLEGTAQAVTAEQAAQLLPLWQLRKELSTNSAAAPQEIEAVVKQIQSTMTAEQMQAIDNMKLTQQDAMTFVQGQVSTTQSSAKRSGSQGNGGGFAPPDGGPGGGIPEVGFSASTSQTTTSQSTQAQSASNSNAASSEMIDLMIQFLQKKIGA